MTTEHTIADRRTLPASTVFIAQKLYWLGYIDPYVLMVGNVFLPIAFIDSTIIENDLDFLISV